MAQPSFFFPPFRLDLVARQLWHGDHLVALSHKPFAVLAYLVQRRGEVVVPKELLAALWRNTQVSEETIKVYVKIIRKALQDNAKTPQFLATIRGEGYCFIASVTTHPASGFRSHVPSVDAKPTPHPQPPIPSFVGRETELARLHHYWEKALTGERQLVFITGEPGIGKTTLVNTFVSQLSLTPGLSIARGQCVNHFGSSEAYFP